MVSTLRAFSSIESSWIFMARIKISLVVCLFQVLGVYGLPRMVAAESEEQAIIRENREAMKATWRGRVTLEENSCYYRTQPENRISFKTKGRQIGKAFKLSGFQNTPFTMQRNEDFEYHLVFLATLIMDMRTGKNTDLDFDKTNYPKAKYMLAQPRELLDAASIAWASHGIMMWRSGSHIPTTNLRKEFTTKVSEDLAMGVHVDNIIAIAKGEK